MLLWSSKGVGSASFSISPDGSQVVVILLLKIVEIVPSLRLEKTLKLEFNS